MNGGYLNIPPPIRVQVNREFEAFIAESIRCRDDFAFETTLRSDITFRQARNARVNGFSVVMRYVGLRNFEENLRRVRARADSGGHSAPDHVLKAIHSASLRNLPTALREMDAVAVFDNSERENRPDSILTTRRGMVVYRAPRMPDWLLACLRGTEFDSYDSLATT